MPVDNLQRELDRIEKDFGKGSVINPSSGGNGPIEVISTGSLTLDLATGIGGLPRGKIVEIMGWESSGKSTLVLQTMTNAQKNGLKCLLVDGENSFDKKYARDLGLDPDKMLYRQLDEGGGERCYDIAERLIKTKEVGVVVFDSQTSLLPKKALTEENGTAVIGLHARMMSISVPKILTAAAMSNTLVIYISQFREKIGLMFGNPETTNGGNALKFYAHMRIEVRKTVVTDGKGGPILGNKTKCKVVKNKMAPPFGTAEFLIRFGKGVYRTLEILDKAIEYDIIKQAGSWYSYRGSNIGQGESKALTFMEDNEDFLHDIEKQVVEKAKECIERSDSIEEAASSNGAPSEE
jgi:recombination protein RecA